LEFQTKKKEPNKREKIKNSSRRNKNKRHEIQNK
jgi:hypothetical protein